MAKRIKYPVGIQTFSEIISEDYIYVDKTNLIYELAKTSKYVFLSRPRRFGKSLLMSTIAAYFRGEKDLFSGLQIEDLETEWKAYPVFRFDLSPATYVDTSRLNYRIKGCLNSIAEDYSLSVEGPNNPEIFTNLIKQAYLKYGEKIVILIDEYDKPMLDCLHESELHEKLKAEIRGFFSVIKSCDEYIKFAMLTGITKFGKVSVFSGINNLRDISMLPQYNGICGITETEFHRNFQDSIINFAETNSISCDESWNIFKVMYDGYHFSDCKEFIYNPFSVLNAFNDGRISSYWYQSGSPNYLINLIEKNSYKLDNLEGAKRTEIELNDIANIDHDIVPLLYQSGYLTIKKISPGFGFANISKEYVLGFPNNEVNSAFWESLAKRFFRGADGNSAFNLKKCVSDVIEGRPEDFMLSMKSLFADTHSETKKNKEIHFQNMMAIVCKMLGLAVHTEVH